MIKGINKQIIEIRCTDDEYFEKALLFVRADKTSQPRGVLEECAREYCKSVSPAPARKQTRFDRRAVTAAIVVFASLLTAAGTLVIIAMP